MDEKVYNYVQYQFCLLPLLGTMVVANILRGLIFAAFTSLASRVLHQRMFSSLLRAPMSFYDANPVGKFPCPDNV